MRLSKENNRWIENELKKKKFHVPKQMVFLFLLFGYVVFLLCKSSYKKLVKTLTGNIDGKLTYEQKKKVLNVIKILMTRNVRNTKCSLYNVTVWKIPVNIW